MTTLALLVLALAVVAWPLSALRVSYAQDVGRVQRIVSLDDGVLSFSRILQTSQRPLMQRDWYGVSIENRFLTQRPPAWGRWKPRWTRSAGLTQLDIPIVPLLAAGAAALTALLIVPAWRQRRRVRRGLCTRCGYDVRGGTGAAGETPARCPECGEENWRLRPGCRAGRSVRDAGVLFFACVLLLSLGAWWVPRLDQRASSRFAATAFDISWYLQACSPRLSGEVVVVQAGTSVSWIAQRVGSVSPGTVVVLLPGEHDLGETRNLPSAMRGGLRDVWLLGAGRDETTLLMQCDTARRLRIEGVSIDCDNKPFLDLRGDSSLYLRDCRVHNFNSGAGGSNAAFVSGSALLIDGCEFDGRDGNASGPDRFGTALDRRGSNRLYVRGGEILSDDLDLSGVHGVFDRVRVHREGAWKRLLPTGAAAAGVWRRESTDGVDGLAVFELLDDIEVLKRLTGGAARGDAAAWQDPEVFALVHRFPPTERRDFWQSLLLHPSDEVREFAKPRAAVRAAPGGRGSITPMSLDDAMLTLGSETVLAPATVAILRGGEESRARLQRVMEEEGGVKARNAEGLLILLDRADEVLDLLDAEVTRPEP